MEKRKHRIFLDSNVIISGLFSDRGAPRLILDILSLGLPVLSGLTGRFNLIEVERNLLASLPKLGLEIVPLPSPEDLRPLHGSAEGKDLPVLASAINGKADYFVSGDKRLMAAIARNSAFPFRAAGPAELLDGVLPKILSGRGE